MAVFRVERNTGYTVMSNHHLRNKELSLKAKGLLSQMLSLPEDWDYTLAGLSYINREKIDAIREAVRELERAGYIQRSRERDEKGRLRGTDYIIYEQPPNLDLPTLENPTLENPTQEKPTLEKPTLENPMQLNKDIQKTDLSKKEKSNTDLSNNHSIPILSPNPSPLREETAEPERKGTEAADAYSVYEEIIKDNIEYFLLTSHILVIAEKPSVAQTIAAVLGAKEKKDGFLTGSGYIVSWCVGHLVGLSEAAAYGEQYKKWSYDSLPILPQEWKYTVAADKEKQFKTLKELMHRADVSEVVNACDAGREGELIFRFVYEMAGCKKPMRRLWISSMEDSAIKEGFSRLKNGEEYDALFASALCRAKADWLIGINATRLFSVLYNHTLNVGRVQTPTLKMLVDRDAAITTFKKEKYYHVRLTLSGAEAASEKLSDRYEADRLKAACETSKAVCTSLVKEKKTAAPPKLFDLTSLQREANRLFGYTAKQTLDLAQALYEKRLLTYPRTDSAFLTDDMGDTAAGIIKLLCGKFSFMAGNDFTPELGKVLNSKKVSDHHAIIPTMEGIEDMARELVNTYPFLSDDKAQMFKPEREALGNCPRCGSPVYEGKKNYYCSNKECIFTMWKNDRFFEERKVTFTPKIAAALLQSGKVNVKKLYSPKTGKTYDGTIVLADTGGKYVNYRVELPKKK